MTSPILVALDFPDASSALALASRFDPAQCGVKIGKELFTAAGPDLVRECVGRGFRGLPRPQVPRHSEHLRASVRGGHPPGRVDGERPRERGHGHDVGRAQGGREAAAATAAARRF